MTAVVYDSGALIAADKNDRRMWADHKIRLEMGIVPLVPSPVVAQASRSPRQVQLRRLLLGCEVVGFDEGDAHRAGAVLAKSKTNDIVDACVVALAVACRGGVVTSDPTDIARLAGAIGASVEILRL